MDAVEFKLKHASEQFANCAVGDLYLSGVYLHKVVQNLLDERQDPYAFLNTSPQQIREFYIASLNVAVSQIGKDDANYTIQIVQDALEKGEVTFSDLEISADAFQEEVAFREKEIADYKISLKSDCTFWTMTRDEAIAYLLEYVDEMTSSDLDYFTFKFWVSLYKKHFFMQEPISPADLGMTDSDFEDLRISAAMRVGRELLANCRHGDEGRYGYENDGFSLESLRLLLLDEQVPLSAIGTDRQELGRFRHPDYDPYIEDAKEDLEACRSGGGSIVTGATVVVALEQIGVLPEEIGLTATELNGFRQDMLRDFID